MNTKYIMETLQMTVSAPVAVLAATLSEQQKSGNKKYEIELPLVLKDKVLLTPGTWNGLGFSEEELQKGFKNTDWQDKDNYALIYDHDERATNWLGNVLNIKLSENNELIGDLEIWDESLALKLLYGKAKLGISARVLGTEDEEGNFIDFTFNNFSVVYEPACKNAYINLASNGGITSSTETQGEEIGAHTNEPIKVKKLEEDCEDLECIRKKRKMGIEEFYAVIREPYQFSLLPIYDEESVHNSIINYNETKFNSIEEANIAHERIMKAAEKFNIEIKEDDEDLNTDERRSIKMPEETKQEGIVEAAQEEEVVEETKDSEELGTKLSQILSELKILSEAVAKLSEPAKELAEEEPEEEPAVEAEEPKEEAEAEEEVEEESELAQLRKEVQELHAVKEEPNLKAAEMSEKRMKGYTNAEVGFAEVLLNKARL